MSRTRLNERPDHVRVPVRAGLMQRRVSMSVLMIRVDAASKDDLDIFPFAVPTQEPHRRSVHFLCNFFYFTGSVVDELCVTAASSPVGRGTVHRGLGCRDGI